MSERHRTGEPARPPGDAEPLAYSYLAHRKVIGYLGIALLPVLVLVTRLRSTSEIQTSISAYYYTGAGAVFVGVLFAIGIFLFSYRGYEGHHADWWAGKAAFGFAIGVALFPTGPPEGVAAPPWWSPPWLHYVSAFLLFRCLHLLLRLAVHQRHHRPQGPFERKKVAKQGLQEVCVGDDLLHRRHCHVRFSRWDGSGASRSSVVQAGVPSRDDLARSVFRILAREGSRGEGMGHLDRLDEIKRSALVGIHESRGHGTTLATRSAGYMTAHRSLYVSVTALVLTSCASGGGLPPAATPDEIPTLEAQIDADAFDVDAGLRLAAAYRDAGRGGDARALVSTQLDLLPDDPGLIVMAGLLDEDAGDFSSARLRYEAFLIGGPVGALRDEIEWRLDNVRAEELRADIRVSLAREAELRQTTPDQGAVGVFPFMYEGEDPSWQPLGVALAELLITDLGITGRLAVLERVKVQVLLDELALAQAAFVDPTTAARSGRLLGAGHVVQGRYRIEGGTRIAGGRRDRGGRPSGLGTGGADRGRGRSRAPLRHGEAARTRPVRAVGRGVDTSGAGTNQREANGERSGSARVWPGPQRVRRRRLPAGRGLLRGGVLARPVVRTRAVASADRGPSHACPQRAGDSAAIRPGVQARQATSSGPGDPERSSVGPPAASAEARSTPAGSARGGARPRPRRYDDPARARISAARR